MVPVIICGMHLCGVLSPRAVDLASNPAVIGIVLSPCCFPARKLLDIRVAAGSNNTETQYRYWCKFLADYIAPNMTTVVSKEDPHIKSIRNGVIIGWGDAAYTPPSRTTDAMFFYTLTKSGYPTISAAGKSISHHP